MLQQISATHLTAGYCVDGTPSMSSVTWGLEGWKYENCDQGYPGLLGRWFDADVAVEAISGIGVTQNAAAKDKWQLGPMTMPGYFERTMQTRPTPPWDFARFTPEAVLVSLGGNDFNHQGGKVPSNSTFSAAYATFLSRIFAVYDGRRESSGDGSVDNTTATKVVAVCGQGSPVEAKQDPDNNRCRPCPHVEAAIADFRAARPDLAPRLHYVFVPCDGTVATGNGDIGCNGHKNRIGQHEVARFVAPRLAQIMDWNVTEGQYR